MSIYQGLADKPFGDLDENQTALSAKVLQQYILEDNLTEPGDEQLERLMHFSTGFFQRQQEMLAKFEGDMNKLKEWQLANAGSFNDHAKSYPELYKQVAHLAKPPYFMQPWVLAYMVDISVSIHEMSSPEQYEQAPKAIKSSVEYTLRFAENLLTSAYQMK